MKIVLALKKKIKILNFSGLYLYVCVNCIYFSGPDMSLFTLIAGYNNLEVAEYLLEHGADVNAQDKGGLIPLHNAASYGVSMFQ